MRRNATKRILDRRGITIALILTAVAAALFTAVMYTLTMSAARAVQSTNTSVADVVLPAVVEIVEPTTPEVAAPTQTEPAVQVVAEDQTSPAVPDKWEPLMTEAGIPLEDQVYVRALVISGDSLNFEGCSCRIMMASSEYNPVGRFRILRLYVASQYDSWADAQAMAAKGAW